MRPGILRITMILFGIFLFCWWAVFLRGSINTGNNPVAAMTAVNIKGALNDRNSARMKKFGIKLPANIKSIGSTRLFPDGQGTGSYSDFEERVINMLQPADVVCIGEVGNCHDAQVRGAATILSLSAIGVYQILLWHHGKVLDGWDDPSADGKSWSDVNWSNNLEIIYRFMNDLELQVSTAVPLIKKLREQYKGDARDMASAYYSGHPTHWYDVGDYMSAQFGFGSKRKYSGDVLDCYKAATDSDTVKDTSEQIHAFTVCIGKQETGFLQKGGATQTACTVSSLGLLEKYGSDKTCFVGDSYMAGIGRGSKKVWSLKGKSFVPYVADKAKEVLEDEQCKLLVLNGGLNDMYGRSAEEIKGRVPDIKFRYEEVVRLARKKGVETIVVYDVPLIKKSPCGKKGGDCDKKKAVEDATEEVNDFLDDDLDADYVIHTNDLIVGDDATKWTPDGIHPKNYSCLRGRL
jgi:hypothetical protein